MAAWWNSLTGLQQIFVCIGIPATLVLVVQTILLLFGIGDGSDADIDIDPDGFDISDAGDGGIMLFSIRGIVAMFCVAGWAGVVFVDLGLTPIPAVLLAILCGVAALFGIAYLMKAVLKLQSNGNIQIGGAVGKTGEVYIPIPAKGQGRGKINLTLQDRFIEVDAITRADETLKTGETVRVVSTDEAGLVVVERVMQ
jgi:membrane protein implicated in regulation of membrane protease activity